MNNYHIYEEIGRGKYSVVYKGRKKKTIEYVAVKSVERNRRKKLMNEVRIFHNLDHQNILKFYNWYETRNHLWIIFEYCPGGDLYKLMQEDTKLTEPNVKKAAYELVEGLSYLHEQGIIFADLKPSNILVNEFNQLKLADFGLSKKISDLTAGGGVTEDKKKDNVGSPYYMAPEQFAEDGVLSFYSDFWSLGIVMHELATGKVPFAAGNLNKLIKQIAEEPIKDVSNFSDDFNDLVKRLLEKDPIKRMTWHELKNHPFWYSCTPVYTFKGKTIYPEQPQFDKYLNARGINPATFYQQRCNPIADQFLQSVAFSGAGSHAQNSASAVSEGKVSGADIMRLSMNVKRNLMKEREDNTDSGDNYHTNSKSGSTGFKNGAKSNNQSQAASVHEEAKQESVTASEQNNEEEIKLADKNIVLDFGEQQTEEAEAHQMIQTTASQQHNDATTAQNSGYTPRINNSNPPSTHVSQQELLSDLGTGTQPQPQAQQPAQQPHINTQQSVSSQHQSQHTQPAQADKPDSVFYPKSTQEDKAETSNTLFYPSQQQNQMEEIPNEIPLTSTVPMSQSLRKTNVEEAAPSEKYPVKQNNFFDDTPTERHQHSGSKQAQSTATKPQLQKSQSAADHNIQSQQHQASNQFSSKQASMQKAESVAGLSAHTSSKQHSAQKPQSTGRMYPTVDVSKATTARRKSSERQTANLFDPHQSNAATNNNNNQQQSLRRSAIKRKTPQEPTLFTSPQDLAHLCENTLFQAYQVVYQYDNTSQTTNSQFSNTNTTTNNGFATITVANNTQQDDPRAAQTQRIATAPSISQKQSKVPHKPIEQLIIHNSDNQVKPIIGNKEIEKIQEVKVNPESLPFQPWENNQIASKIDTPEIESHLSEVYQALQSNVIVNEKLNTLFYFESIIINSNVSNRLINSAFITLLVKMLRNVKVPGIKSRLSSVVGLLIRHSTVIENELAETEICAVLVETMRDPNVKVRRKAIAALGEYMFYAATQLDDEHVDPVWELSYEAIQTILRCLRISSQEAAQEDDIVRAYACKTLENICAQSKSAGHKFATLETINHLLAIFLTPSQNFCKNNQTKQSPQFYDNLKTSAAVALSHICSLNPQLFQTIFERITPSLYCQTLADGAPRVQQAFITMLNMSLTANAYPRISEILLDEEGFLPSLMRLQEHNQIVIRGKCLLTFLLLFKMDFRWMAVVQNQVKFFNALERVLKDNYKYVQCCLLCLIDGILEIVPTIFQNVAQELTTLINGEGQIMPNFFTSDFDKYMSRDQAVQLQKGGPLFFVSIILDLQTNQLIRNRMLNYPFIRSLSVLLDNTSSLIASTCDNSEGQFTQGNRLTEIAFEFQYTQLLIAESISTNHKVILQMHDSTISYLLPVLLQKVRSQGLNFQPQSSLDNNERESRFLSLKIITDVLTYLLSEESIYIPHSSLEAISMSQPADQTRSQNVTSTNKINTFLVEGLLPLAAHLVCQADHLVPFYGQRILSTIIEKNIRVLKLIRSLKVQDSSKSLMQLITDFYQVNHPSLNKHTIVIVKSLIENKELSFAEMKEYKIIDKTSQLIQTMLTNKKEWCIELLLDINHHMLGRFNEVVKTREREIARHIEDIFSNFDTCVQLLSDHFEIAIIEKASQCLIQMLQLYALWHEKKREIFFVETHMQCLIKAIDCEKKTIQKRVLKCIYWALIQSEYQIELNINQLSMLNSKVETLFQSTDRSIVQTSRQISKILREQMEHIMLEQRDNTPANGLATGAAADRNSQFGNSVK